MKKFIAIALLASSATAFAQHPGYGRPVPRGGWGWAPFIGGAVAGAVIYDIYNRPIVVQQPPVVVNPPVYTNPPVVVAPQTVYTTPPTIVYECVDTLRPSSVPGNEHIVRTCTQRFQ